MKISLDINELPIPSKLSASMFTDATRKKGWGETFFENTVYVSKGRSAVNEARSAGNEA